MDYAEYQRAFFTDPPPRARYRFERLSEVAIAVADTAVARAFYAAALGPTDYVEAPSAIGWRIGDTWLTLHQAAPGTPPAAISFTISMATADEAVRLQHAFQAAGAAISQAQETFYYDRVCLCPVTDPFGSEISIIARLPTATPWPVLPAVAAAAPKSCIRTSRR